MLCSQRIVLTFVVAATMSIFNVASGQCVGCGASSAPNIAAPVVVGPATMIDAGYTTTYSGGCASCGSGGGCSSCGLRGHGHGGLRGCGHGGCSGGSAGGFGYAGGGCPGGNCNVGSGVDHTGRIRAGKADIASQIDQIRAQSEKVRQRNAAWMKPFACADRQAYEAIWNRLYQSGMVQTCTLTDQHFNTKTGELNGLGRAMIQGVMKNSVASERNIYVYTGRGEIDYDSKIRVVNSMISEWYGAGQAQVAATSRFPTSGVGARIELQNAQVIENTPAPQIVIPTGTGSTSDTAAGQ